ncbi:MAG: DUF6288 domain-containing protein [Verrucomicrobia bacterium]|nr:DUF6288 domain-containing protein [Verrucomicrobiota bacterium]
MMTKNTRHSIKLHLRQLVLVLILFFTELTPLLAVPPDLTAGGVPNDSITINLGPTGLRGWVYHVSVDTSASRQIQVKVVDAGSPAAGLLAVDDVILGADGTGAAPVNFSSDARKSLAMAIADAEARSPATLKLLRWQAGATNVVTLTLRTMGAYSTTAPYNCPKSAQILEEGLQYIMASETKGSYSFGTLALLAGNNPANPLNAARQARAQTEARALIPTAAVMATLSSSDPFTSGASPWQRGHELIVLTEYYLKTGDALVLPAIDAISKCIAAGTNVFGTAGHVFAPKWRDGSPNGPLRQGYGAVNSASMPGFLGLLLTKECGVTGPTLDPAITRASRFFAYFAGKGVIPYGEHEPAWQGHENNGKSGLAALCFELQGNRVSEQKFNAKLATAATSEREIGHTGAFFNYLWSPLGAAVGGEQAAASYFSRASWMFDLSRKWNGSFVYDCLYGEGPLNGATYNDFRMSTATLLTYALPLRQLHITGRGHNPSHWLTTTDVSDAEAADGYKATSRSTSQLVADLGSWSPMVQRSAANELGTRTTETTALLPSLHALANDSQGTSRIGACYALGKIASSSSAPVLAALLTDPVNHVRFAAAESLRGFSDVAKMAQLNTILSATVSTAAPLLPFNEEDPMHMAHGRLGVLLFNSTDGVLRSSVAGADRSLLYPAIRAVAQNPIGYVRSTLSTTYKNLNQADFLALADAVVYSAYELTPADKMFSGGDRKAALDVLETYHAAEGPPLSALTIQDEVGFNDEALAVLLRYAGGSSTVKPDPGVVAACKFLLRYGINPTEAQQILDAIAADPNHATLPPLKSIQSVVAGAASLTLPAKWTTLSVTSNDYAKGDSVYTWRKVNGAGNVTFVPNGTGAAKTTTAYFDGAPGQYLFEVKMSDSKNLTEVYSTVAVTLYNSGGTLSPNNPPTANAQSPTVPQAMPTPIILTGSDPENYALTYAVTSQPAHGTLTGTAPYLTYTPAFDYTGSDSFNFQVTDSEGQTSSAAVSITVGVGSGVPVAIYEPFDYATGSLNGKGGSTETGLTGTWFSTSAVTQIASGSLTYGSLPVSGNSFGVSASANNFGGSRSFSTSALAANGLLNDGATLWFSIVVGYGTGGNLTNSRLAFALANSRFSTGNFQYYIVNEGAQLGSGLGVTLGRFDYRGGAGNGYVVATQFRDSTFGTSGFSGNVFGNVPRSTLDSGEQRLVVGKITWGAASDTIELYEPDTDLSLGSPTSTLTVNVNQSAYDTLTFALGDRVTLDEIRFGSNYYSVLAGTVAMTADTTPPTPNPFSFATLPTVIPGSSITMTAATAYDPNGVEYYFTCTSGSGHDSGWQNGTTYTDTGLTPGVTYSYTVKTRDLSPARNEGTVSAAASAVISTVVTVPDVAGMIQSSAESILTSVGLTVGTVQNSFSPTVPVGSIISQSPGGGQTTARGTVVDLALSAFDNTPPTLTGSDIVDDKSGGPVLVNTLVIYTVSFSEDMDASTVSAADFSNTGSSAITIDTVTETSPGVFTVPVTPTSVGTLQLQVNANADLTDAGGNALITTSAIVDNTIITVIPVNSPPVAATQSVTIAKDTAKAITLVATDMNNDPLTYSIISQPTHGTLSGSAPNVTYKPGTNFIGTDSFTFKANDGVNDSAEATVSLAVTPLVFTWNSAIAGDWSDNTKWAASSVSPSSIGHEGYVLNFNVAGTYTATNNLNAGFLLNQINFGGSTATIAGSGLALIVNGSTLPRINQNASSAVIISVPLNLISDTTVGGSGTGAMTFSDVVSGAGSLSKTAPGTLTLSGTNTYSGGTVISGGTVALASGVTGAISTGPVTINSGGILTVNSTALNRALTLNGGTLKLTAGTTDTVSGTIAVEANSTVDFGNTNQAISTISSSMSGVGGLTKTSAGQLRFISSSINYSGPTVVNAGTLQVQQSLYGNDSSKWTPANITLASGAMLILNVGGASDFTPAQATTLFNNISTNVNNNGLRAGSTIAFDISNASGSSVTISGVLTDSTGPGGGSVNVRMGSAKTLILSGSNTYTGKTSVSPWKGGGGATLSVSSFNSVVGGTASSCLGAPTTVANGTIDIGNASQQVSTGLIYTGTGETTDRVLNFPGNGSSPSTIDQAGSGLLKFTSAFTSSNAKELTLTGVGSGEIAGALPNFTSIIKSGTGIWTLSGTNTYTGTTIISAGTLQFAKEVALYNNTPASWTKTNLLVSSGSILALNVGGSGEFTNTDVTTLLTNLGGLGAAVSNNGLRSGSKIAFDTTNASGGIFTIADNMANSTGTGGGAIGLTKLGTGTLALIGTNTYTGATAVNAGKLLINSPGSLHASSIVTINGGTLGGSGTINGSVTVAVAGSLAPGASGAGTLVIGGGLNISSQAVGSGKLLFELATPATSDKIAVTGTLNIGSGLLGFNDFVFTNLGGLTAGTYKLITSGGISGSLDGANLSGSIGAYTGTLRITGNDLELVVTLSGFAAWQIANGTVGTFNADHDNDGVSNGLEYFFGGPNGNTTGITALPGVTNTNGTLSVTWTMGAGYTGTYGTHFVVETSDTLIGTWTTETLGGTVIITGSNVKYTFPAPLGSKKFVRLRVNQP